MPPMHCTTLCWLVQYYQCADWRAGCASPCVAREAREARLSVNPTARWAPQKLLPRKAAGIAAAKAPALCFAFARVLRQLSVYHSCRTLARCFFIHYRRLQAAYSRIIVE
ncbi:hypothetical protein EMIHUDRAFT_202880 [Emiliania huxleyi CCMP1516]|uniref:Secreted protein n=2 Tax=Emiliania huxleyi TaxID=2903 RepID=A0A0D3K8Z4_EMIH1|nr:hypothetical protein EMIHUDRAFT_202880 [Emiliania huxleyi CCMP1516]EOD32229.1 hypothetical protein EMIHUDRAFT_202880 [Emiliania huxleyi CCMP1516]|eukprot:XP_005784658.1 hypothetical protein EMIHUDRAFT_202880 [Emiliania huxleyi CCMP1516]